jgi:hypothetical protein
MTVAGYGEVPVKIFTRSSESFATFLPAAEKTWQPQQDEARVEIEQNCPATITH